MHGVCAIAPLMFFHLFYEPSNECYAHWMHYTGYDIFFVKGIVEAERLCMLMFYLTKAEQSIRVKVYYEDKNDSTLVHFVTTSNLKNPDQVSY